MYGEMKPVLFIVLALLSYLTWFMHFGFADSSWDMYAPYSNAIKLRRKIGSALGNFAFGVNTGTSLLLLQSSFSEMGLFSVLIVK